MENGGRGKRRRFSDEYKAEAVRLVGESGKRAPILEPQSRAPGGTRQD